MPEAPTDPKDVADMLEAIARRMRRATPAEQSVPATAAGGFYVSAPPAAEASGPSLGEVDVFSDSHHVTVTAETRNADAAHVHVSVSEGRLHINVGDGAAAVRRELALPAPVDEEHAYATFRNGVLDVVLPRRGAVVRGG